MNTQKPTLKAPSKIQKITTNLPSTSSALSSSTHSLASVDISLKSEVFSVGEKVWVNGIKPGVVRYLGSTQFATGDWAGVELEQPVGKNNGIVDGIEYFQCKPQHGIFTKTSKLTKEPISTATTAAKHPSPRISGNRLNINERVCVQSTSGSKVGVIRYLGPTEFAVGDWAGIELEEPTGKNDGSVAGKRYFTCEPKYGLFAPIYKVSKAMAKTSISPNLSEPLSAQHRVGSGSAESLNSSISSTSSISRNRIKLGINSLQKTSTKATSISNGRIKEDLKEKEAHIAKLTEERDLERQKVVQVRTRAEKAESDILNIEQDYINLKRETNKLEGQVKTLIEENVKTKESLLQQIEQDKRKIEDLQFRLEEEALIRMETSDSRVAQLQEETFQKDEQIAQLESQLEHYRKESTTLLEKLRSSQRDYNILQDDLVKETKSIDVEKLKESHQVTLIGLKRNFSETEKGYIVKLEELEHQLKSIEMEKINVDSKVADLQEENFKKDEQISELDSQLAQQYKENSSIQMSLEQMRENMKILEELKEKGSSEQQGTEKKIQELKENMEAQMDLKIRQIKEIEDGYKTKLEELEKKLNLVEVEKDKMKKENVKILEELKEKGSLEQQMATKEIKELKEHMEKQTNTKNREIKEVEDSYKTKLENLEKKISLIEAERDNAKKESTEILEAVKEKGSHDQQATTKEIQQLKENMEMQINLKNREIKEKEESYQIKLEELDKKLALLEEEKNNMVKENMKILEEMKEKGSLEQQLQELKDHMEKQMKLKNSEIKEKEDFYKANLETLEKKLSNLEAEKLEKAAVHMSEEAEAELSKLRHDLTQLTEEHRCLKKERDNLQLELKRTSDAHAQTKEKLLKFINQLRVLEEEYKAYKEEECQKHHQAIEDFKKERDDLQEQIRALRDQLGQVDLDKNHQNKELENETEAKKNLTKEVSNLQSQVETLQKREKSFEDQIFSLEKRIGDLTVELGNEKREYEQISLQFKNEKSILKDNLQMLQADMDSCKKRREASYTKEEYETLQNQVDFLNTVIVEMHDKNDQLKILLEALQNPLKDEKEDSFDTPPEPRRLPPRKFCDYCECFDLHETEDCPSEIALKVEQATHSTHHTIRGEIRPYCEQCEKFGHWTLECQDNDTF